MARPKPTVRTDRDSVSSRPRTNKTAHNVKLEDMRPTVNEDLLLQSDVVNAACDNKPELSVLIAEVDQTGNMEEELDEIVQHQQDQAQAVQTE